MCDMSYHLTNNFIRRHYLRSSLHDNEVKCFNWNSLIKKNKYVLGFKVAPKFQVLKILDFEL